MQLISNASQKHCDVLNNEMRSAHEIVMLVAFLRRSGLALIEVGLSKAIQRGANVKIIVGLDLCVTEPQALTTLLRMMEKFPRATLLLCNDGRTTFHPKLYYFSRGDLRILVIGSANLTGGGLEENLEVSLHIQQSSDSSLAKQLRAYISEVERNNRIVAATPIRISQYEQKFKIFERKRKAAEKEAKSEVKNEVKRLGVLDEEKLQRYLTAYRADSRQQQDLRQKRVNYLRARKVLDRLASERINSKGKFLEIYGELVGGKGRGHLWHSGSVHRSINMIAGEYKRFISMLHAVRLAIDQPVAEAFDLGIRYARRIRGLGPNVLTEILNTYSPRRFSVANDNPVTALSDLGCEKFSLQKTSFTGEKYKRFNDLLLDLGRTCDFKDLSQVDHFLNYIYWRVTKRSSRARVR